MNAPSNSSTSPLAKLLQGLSPSSSSGSSQGGDDDDIFGIGRGGSSKAPADTSSLLAALVLAVFASMMMQSSGGEGMEGMGDVFKNLLKGMGGDGANTPQPGVSADNLHPADMNDAQTKKVRQQLDSAGLTIMSTIDLGHAPQGPGATSDLERTATIDIPKVGDAVKLFNDATGQYVAASSDPEKFRQQVEADTSGRVSITNTQGETHFFEQIAVTTRDMNPKSGYAGGAYKAISENGRPLLDADGSGSVYIANPGYTGKLDVNPMDVLAGKRVTENSAQGDSVELVSSRGVGGYQHNLNPQTIDALAFVDKVHKAVGTDKMHYVSGAHSAGIAAMDVEAQYLAAKGLDVTTIPLDQVGGSHQIAAIKEQLANPDSPLYKKLRELNISDDKIKELSHYDFSKEEGLNVMFKGDDGQLHMTAMANMPIGIGSTNEALIAYKQGQHLGEGNAVAGKTDQILYMGQGDEIGSHGIGNIFNAINNLGQSSALLEAGQAMRDSNVTVADGSAPGAQTNLPGQQTVASGRGPAG